MAQFLSPGDIAVGEAPLRLRTVLGSCVAVCLWDGGLRCGGMNHFILPTASSGQPDERYGERALPALLARLTAVGARESRLVAKVFGGADVLATAAPCASVGRLNVAFAFAYLERAGIPVVAHRVGGASGIVVEFDPATGAVEVADVAAGLGRRWAVEEARQHGCTLRGA